MADNLFQYFDGRSATPYQVRIELTQDTLYLFDASHNHDNGLPFLLHDCNCVVLKNKAFIYLHKGATEYIVIPIDSDDYPAIIAAIKDSETGWYSKLFSQKWYTLAGGVAAIMLSVYLFFTYAMPPIAMAFISVKQEIKLGNTFYNSFTEGDQIDSTGTFILQKFADNLHLSSKYPIRVTVVDDSIVNAFALPGGHIVVFTGIINKLENPQELVALLSHESSHINKRHSLQSMVSRFSSSLLFSLFTKDINGLTKGILDNVNMLRVLSYSRTLESQADEEGMKLMVNNKVNPIGMKWLMEELKKLNHDVPSSMSFLSTHPLTDQRIHDADVFTRKYIQMNALMPDVQISLWDELKKGSKRP